MTILKTKTKKGYGTVTLEHVTLKDAQKPGVTYTVYAIKKNGVISAVRSYKKDATAFFKRECIRTFGPMSIR